MDQMKRLGFEEHKRRIGNFKTVTDNVKTYRARHRFKDYAPGQAFYNFGGYPGGTSYTPTEYDHAVLKELSERGVEIIQTHSEMWDTMRVVGADKFTTVDPVGIHKFVDAVHKNGLKILPYISSGFFEMTDPDFKPEFTRPEYKPLCEVYYHLAKCPFDSAEWISYMLPRVEAILDTYEFDGLYNDMGAPDLYTPTPAYREQSEDVMYRLYNMVKARGGIMKVHFAATFALPFQEKVYDYYWIGEATNTYDAYTRTRDFKPYLIPCVDNRKIPETDPEDQYARFIPFMQFPILKYGRYIGYAKADPEINKKLVYRDELVTRWGSATYNFFKEHPNGPYSYSEWSSIPEHPDTKEIWTKYLSLYKPMVTEGSVCFMDIDENEFIKSPKKEKVHASVFTNEDIYMVVSNLTDEPYELELAEPWLDRLSGVRSNKFTISPLRMVMLIK